jgi:CheY-like chemotaxis protein
VGINDADLARIFDPYFTTKEHGKGTGLGLSSVWGIMKEIGGCLHVESRLGEGTRFRVYFPVSKDARADRPQEVPVVVSLLGEGQRVLVVQPDAELREMLVWVLIKNGYKALAADGAAQAKRWLEDPVVSLDVAVMEGDDAGKEGWEFVSRWAQSGRPGICLVGAQSAVPEWASIAALAKPFRPEEFLRRLAEVLTAAGAGTNP